MIAPVGHLPQPSSVFSGPLKACN